MAIKGISDVKVLPRLGKIRTGIKKKSAKGTEYPEEVPYFVLNPLEEELDKKGNPTGNMRENEHIKALIEMYGDKPSELQVVFPVDDLSLVADPFMKWWGGNVKAKKSKLLCRGDGEYAVYKGQQNVTGLDGQIPDHLRASGYNRICNKDLCPQAQQGLCKPNMNLRVVIPDYSLYGVFQIDTTSVQAITEILSAVDVAKNALRLERINQIAGVPFRLFRERRSNNYDNVNYILRLEVNQTRLKEEQLKRELGKPTLLAIADSKYTIEPAVDEPNYDLLPQSDHGRYQTGDEVIEGNPVVQVEQVEALPEVDKTEWLKDPEVVDKFKALASLKNRKATMPRMKATAEKFEVKEELINYLTSQLEAGTTQAQA
jgi:hypothetical protein